MKCFGRCSISGSFGDLEIPLLLNSFYSFRVFEKRIASVFIYEGTLFCISRKTESDGEFGWGGTSVKS